MRRGSWLTGVLGLSGIVGVGALLLADEGSFLQQSRYRGEAPPASVPAARAAGRLPNYHQELFGTPRPTARPAVPEARPITSWSAADEPRFPEIRPMDEGLLRGSRPTAEAADADQLVPAEFRSDRHAGGLRRILAAEPEESPFRTPAELQAEAQAAPSQAAPSQAPLHHMMSPMADAETAEITVTPPAPRARQAVSAAAPTPPPAPFAPSDEQHPLTSLPPVEPPQPVASSTSASAEGQYPALQLRWSKRGEMLVGQTGTCQLIVKNSGQATAVDVIVEAYFPPSVRLIESQPAPAEAATHLVWQFESLAPGAEQTIELKLIPSQAGALAPKALARFTQGTIASFSIDEPRLEVSLRGPSEVTLGDPASQIVLVSNSGTGVARNVTVLAHIPAGLEHPQGTELALDIGTLGPGETRRVRLGLAAARGGRHTVAVEAAGDAGLRHASSTEVTVISPSLKLDVVGPGLRYMGRRATYEITVTNDGTAASNSVRLTHRLPEGFRFVKADEGGSFHASQQTVEWFVDRIEAGASQQLRVEVEAVKLGEFVHQFVATSEQGVRAEQQVSATVDGTASLVLEIIDQDDPVEVGLETAYEIRVRNEGSKPATHVGLVCELPQGLELINAEGPAEHAAEQGTIVFQPLATLEHGKTAIFHIAVRGTVGGHHRFRALLTSESITRPQTVEEFTRFYGE